MHACVQRRAEAVHKQPVAPDCVVSSVEPNRCVAVHGTALMPNASTPPRSPPASFQSKVVFGLASVLQYSISCNFFPCHIFPHKMLHLGFERALIISEVYNNKFAQTVILRHRDKLMLQYLVKSSVIRLFKILTLPAILFVTLLKLVFLQQMLLVLD